MGSLQLLHFLKVNLPFQLPKHIFNFSSESRLYGLQMCGFKLSEVRVWLEDQCKCLHSGVELSAWHRNKTLGDPVCLNYVCRRERINHCWCLHIGFRRNIAFYRQLFNKRQLTGYILKAAEGKRWNMGQVNG